MDGKSGMESDVSWLGIVSSSAASALTAADVMLGAWDSHDNVL